MKREYSCLGILLCIQAKMNVCLAFEMKQNYFKYTFGSVRDFCMNRNL